MFFFFTLPLEDPCYLPHAAGREEFLFSEVGKVYGGSHNNVLGRYGSVCEFASPRSLKSANVVGWQNLDRPTALAGHGSSAS